MLWRKHCSVPDEKMSIKSVLLEPACYISCVTHCNTSPDEEVTGLLIGETTENEAGEKVVHCMAPGYLPRSVRSSDRVEVDPIKLVEEGSKYVDEISATLGKSLRIVGWYHSHPKITIHPSHVDLNTQAQWQTMDSDFVGLIFSVFCTDKHKTAVRMQVGAFQTHVDPSDNSRSEIEISIKGPPNMVVSKREAVSQLRRQGLQFGKSTVALDDLFQKELSDSSKKLQDIAEKKRDVRRVLAIRYEHAATVLNLAELSSSMARQFDGKSVGLDFQSQFLAQSESVTSPPSTSKLNGSTHEWEVEDEVVPDSDDDTSLMSAQKSCRSGGEKRSLESKADGSSSLRDSDGIKRPRRR